MRRDDVFSPTALAGQTFRDLAKLAGITLVTQEDKERFALFALTPHPQEPLKAGWIHLHLLLWRYTIYHLVLVDTEDATFKPHEVWQATWTRYERKALTKQIHVKDLLRQAESRGAIAPDTTKEAKPLTPLATFDAEGQLTWDSELVKRIRKLSTAPPKKGRRNNS